jgi:ABC-type dipeptide/oligopeptide/nickel transport system ATPase component
MGKMKLTKSVAVIAAVAVAGSLTAATWPTKKPVYMISANSAVSLNPIVTTGDVIAGSIRQWSRWNHSAFQP